MPNSLQYYELKRISSTRRYLTEDAAKLELVLVTSCAFVQIRVLQLSSHGHSQVCYSTDAAAERPAKYCCTPYSVSEHHAIKPAHGLSYSNSTGSQVLNENTKLLACQCYNVTTGFSPCYLSELLHPWTYIYILATPYNPLWASLA